VLADHLRLLRGTGASVRTATDDFGCAKGCGAWAWARRRGSDGPETKCDRALHRRAESVGYARDSIANCRGRCKRVGLYVRLVDGD